MTGVWVEHVTSGQNVQDCSNSPRCTVLLTLLQRYVRQGRVT